MKTRGRSMRVRPHLWCTMLFVGVAAAQAPSSPGSQTRPTDAPLPTATITTKTQLVVVDVVVRDKSGNPVRGLHRSDFVVEENRKPQGIKTFDEHSAADLTHTKLPPPLHLPAGTFTDFQPAPEDTTLNVLLLDALNTPMADQIYVRNQLLDFVKNEKPGTRIAIFGLTDKLTLLQGFSSDPEVLKAAVEHRIPRASALLEDVAGTNNDPVTIVDLMTEEGTDPMIIANLQQFQAENAVFQTQQRVNYTADAFETIARYLSGFPGRKNLIWFSGSFPLTIFADPTILSPFAAQNDASDQLRAAGAALARARVAVYPIDARGLQNVPMIDASRSPRPSVSQSPAKYANDAAAFSQANFEEHVSMEQVAEDTGGHAFYNNNGLAAATSKAIEAGSHYYTLTYSPPKNEQRGGYHTIQVKLQGDVAAHGLNISYRRGYYDEDASARRPSPTIQAAPVASAATANPAYARRAMDRGAPAPGEILFKVRVLPDSTATESTVAPNNELNAPANVKGPFRRYNLDFAALPSDFSLPGGSDGRRHSAIEFVAMVYDAKGKLLNMEADMLKLNLPPENYMKALPAGVEYHLQISAPAKGENFLRIGIHDTISGRMGVVEVPTTSVDRLPPLP